MSADTHVTLREANVARQTAWCPEQVPDLSFRGVELAGEVGEALNVIKKLERERLGWRGSRDTVEHLAEELADIVICTDLVAISAGIDLDAAVVAKFNATSAKVGLPQRLVPEAAALDAEKASGVYVPGVWRCAKCDFRLIQSNLNAMDGTVTARDEPGDTCPNCDGSLWRCTWQDEAKEAYKTAESQMDRALAAEAENAALRSQVERMDKEIAEDERDRLFEKVMQKGPLLLPAHEQSIRQFLHLERAMLPSDRRRARAASSATEEGK